MPPKTNKQKVITTSMKYFFITLGSFLLAFGVASFLVPFDLVNGGVSSIGIIVQYFVTKSGSDFQVTDIVTWVIQIAMTIASFFLIGKRFTIRTIYAVLLYPALFTLMIRVPVINGQALGPAIANLMRSEIGSETISAELLAAIFGGAAVGGGVGICYLAGGSTGGLDVVSVYLAKRFRVKESVSAFLMDFTILLVGLICMQNLIRALIGVVSALICAGMVQYLYVRQNGYVIADIVSDKFDEIREFVQDRMDRTTTLIEARGGYTGEKRTILRVAFAKKNLIAFKSAIAEIDPRAFVTFTEASMINGEGFDPLKPSPLSHLREVEKTENPHE